MEKSITNPFKTNKSMGFNKNKEISLSFNYNIIKQN